MSVRSDLESRLNDWAASQNPPIEVAWEGFDYDKPSSGLFLEPKIIPSRPAMAGVSGVRFRELGIFHVNVWGLNGNGTHETETIAKALVDLFPVIPKFSATSIESVGNIGNADIINGYRVVPVSFLYRRETQTN